MTEDEKDQIATALEELAVAAREGRLLGAILVALEAEDSGVGRYEILNATSIEAFALMAERLRKKLAEVAEGAVKATGRLQ